VLGSFLNRLGLEFASDKKLLFLTQNLYTATYAGLFSAADRYGFSLLEKPTLRGLQTRAIPTGQGRLRKHLHRTKKIGLYFRGVKGPPLQTTITAGIVTKVRPH